MELLQHLLVPGPPPVSDGRVTVQAPEELEASLHALLVRCQEAWPDLGLDAAAYLAHLGARLPAALPLDKAIEMLHGPDLYLACACARGVRGALAAFERHVLSQVPSSFSHLAPAPGFVDEVMQVLREKLFVAPAGSVPKIADYAGTGSLLSWVRIAALRTALDLRRAQAPRKEVEPEEPLGALPRDPELDYIRDRYRVPFQDAFRAAFARLSAEQRNLLRLHYIDGLNIDRIGGLFRVHRSTVARWLSAAGAQILDETRRLLRERLQISEAEFDSLAEVVRSQLELNITSCLRDPQK